MVPPSRRHLIPYAILFVVVAAWTLAFQHIPFFWDTVQLGSKHAHHFYENGLAWTALPTEIDSGHPPAFGFYLAVIWTLFGKSLALSHWAMFPFLLGIAWLTYALGLYLGGKSWAFWLVPILFLDPVIAGQSTLVGPDIVLVCCFLLAVWSLLLEKQAWATIAILGLCLISTRGMMTVAALFFLQILSLWISKRKFPDFLKKTLPFVPGVVAAALFLIWHYQNTGWIGFHPNSPWAAAFERVDANHFAKNILILGWRWVDLGRIVEWVVLIALVLHTPPWKTPLGKKSSQLVQLVVLAIGLLLCLGPSALLYKNLSAHRYFLPVFASFHLLVFHWISIAQWNNRIKKGLLILLILGLGTGNLWLYPQGISMDWDATLAHLPYHRLRAEMMTYIDEQKIEYAQIGSEFPNVNTGEDLLLNGDQRKCAKKDFSTNRFILISNIYNDFSEAEYKNLKQNWRLMKKLEQSGVWISLYKKTN